MIFENININALIVTGGATVGCYYLYKKIMGSDPIYDASNTVVSVYNDCTSLSLKDIPIERYIKNGLIVSSFVTFNYALQTMKLKIYSEFTYFSIYNLKYDTRSGSIMPSQYENIPEIFIQTEYYILAGTGLYVIGSIYYPILKIPMVGLISISPVILYKILNQYIPAEPLLGIELNNIPVSPMVGIVIGLLASELARSSKLHITYELNDTYGYQNAKIIT